MQRLDLSLIDDNDLVQCANCGYIDIAGTFKDSNNCWKCQSQALLEVYEINEE